MKRSNRFISILIAVLTIVNLSFTAFAVDLPDTSLEVTEEKIICNASIDDDFSDSRVLVVMNAEESRRLKDYSAAVFPEVKNIRVKDLSAGTKSVLKAQIDSDAEIQSSGLISVDNSMQVDADKYRQILCLELEQPGKANVMKAIVALSKRSDVLYAGPDYPIYIDEAETNAASSTINQWSLTKINASGAWNITEGSSQVVVAVADTGIKGTHPNLVNRINASLCRDFTSGSTVVANPPTDPNGHGTHVAGIIGSQSTSGVPITGVCKNVTMVSLRVFDSNGYGYSSHLASAIDYSISKSIPTFNFSGRWYKTIDNVDNSYYNYPLKASIANYPGLFVCASGNEGEDNDSEQVYPANFDLPNLITVASSTSNDTLSSFSNYGKTTVNLVAPGSNIISLYTNSSGYISMNGTSMATPHVTGVAALIRAVNRELTAPEIKALILGNVDKIDALSTKCSTGGRLNAYKAVRAATKPQTFIGDVNGDGRDDLILSRAATGKRALTVYLGQPNGGFGNAITTVSTRNFYYHDPAYVGDFNGDGRTDLVIMWTNGGKRQLLVYTGKADGTFNEGVNLSSTRNHDLVQLPAKCLVADVNGDGKDDFVVQYRNTNGKRYALVYKGKSTSPYLTDATTNALQSTYDYKYNSTVMMGDMNKDGKADMVIYCPVDTATSLRQIIVYTGTANGTFNEGAAITAPAGYLSHLSTPCKVFIADQNGDGYDDVVVHFANNNGKRCTIVYKGISASPYVNNTTAYALSSTNNFVDEDPVLIADVNGDGRDDMIVIYAISGKRRILIYTAKANEKYNTGTVMSSTQPLSNVYFPCFNYIADVNGDGRDDLVVKLKNGNNVKFLTYLGTSSGTFNEAVETIPATNIPFYIAS